MPTVTVIIPVFNRAHVVERAIASVLAQEVPAGDWSILRKRPRARRSPVRLRSSVTGTTARGTSSGATASRSA